MPDIEYNKKEDRFYLGYQAIPRNIDEVRQWNLCWNLLDGVFNPSSGERYCSLSDMELYKGTRPEKSGRLGLEELCAIHKSIKKAPGELNQAQFDNLLLHMSEERRGYLYEGYL